MKLQLAPRRHQRASGLLLFIVVTFVLFIGGCAVYELLKWAKRVDTGEPIPRPGFTNDESIIIPDTDPPSTITGGRFINPHIWFEYVEFEEPGLTAAPQPLLSRPDPFTPRRAVALSRQPEGVVLEILDGTGPQSRVTFASLGVPVDAWGMPTSLTWQSGEIPTGTPETWHLQRSTNFVQWETIQIQNLLPGLTNLYLDPQPGAAAFYRAIRP